MAQNGITNSTYSWVILVGPPRQERERQGIVRIGQGATYRAKIQSFTCQEGKPRKRLICIDGPVEVVQSIREPGEILLDYQVQESRSADYIDDDAWYKEILDKPQYKQIYDKGHLIAAQFGGPTHSLNMAPQLATANRRSSTDGRWNDIERQMRRMLEENDAVRVGNEVRRRREFPKNQDVVLIKRGQGHLRVTLSYDDTGNWERSLIPIDYCLDLRIFGAPGLVAHAWNSVLCDVAVSHNLTKKSERSQWTQRATSG